MNEWICSFLDNMSKKSLQKEFEAKKSEFQVYEVNNKIKLIWNLFRDIEIFMEQREDVEFCLEST